MDNNNNEQVVDDVLYIFETAEEIFNFHWNRHIALLDTVFRDPLSLNPETILYINENVSLPFDIDSTLNPLDDIPPKHILEQRKRRRLVLQAGEKSFYKWKTILKMGIQKCNNMCTICGEEFHIHDQVIQGAKGQFYHRSEMLKWIRQPSNTYVKDPNTNIVLQTVSPPIKKRKTAQGLKH